ncbi:MAG: 50S ribosome-binding GTPase [Thiotrichaceae bacterium]|nr:50S ribosome-binding GTPase [Thiotrichaceae bacterium]
MKIAKKFNRLVALGVVVLTLTVLTVIFFVTQSAIGVWNQLSELSSAFFYSYFTVIAGIISLAGYWVYRLFKPNKLNDEDEKVSKETIIKDLEHAEETGMDTSNLREELVVLAERKETGAIYVSLFGDISTGKSSIIKAILPSADVKIDIRGGSTVEVSEYTWESTSGDKLILTDLPGRNEALGFMDDTVHDEAVRSQIVIYVTDTDLTRTQFEDIQLLESFGKPMIVVINKCDRLTAPEREALQQRLGDRVGTELDIVFTQTGGSEEIIRIFPDGSEQVVLREREAKVEDLAEAIQDLIDDQVSVLGQLRDASVFVLVKQKLDMAKRDFQRDKAMKIVNSSTRKAVVGAMAAISPGTDLIIQGILATLMVKEICKLYNVPVRQIDIDQFINFSQGHMKTTVPLILAVAGNGLKAFPGIGTVTGGLVHAVSYGIIFNALGRAIMVTLETRGKFKAAPASLTFKEMLGENMESRTKLFAQLVFDQKIKK